MIVTVKDFTVGSKVKFECEKQRYTVQACDQRYVICTKPFNPKKTVLYTIIDLKEGVRGPENLVFGMGAETREQCEEMLDRLNGRYPERGDILKLYKELAINPAGVDWSASEVSHRHRLALDVEKVYPPDHV